MSALSGHDPFIMIADGRASILVPSGLKDGPLPLDILDAKINRWIESQR
jgi:hypothetical protein